MKLGAEILETAAGEERQGEDNVLEPRQWLCENDKQQYLGEHQSRQSYYHILLCRVADGLDGRGDIGHDNKQRLTGCIHSFHRERFDVQMLVAQGNLNSILKMICVGILLRDLIENRYIHFPAVGSDLGSPA